MVSVTNSGVLPEMSLQAGWLAWPGRRFVTEVFDGADEALAALDSVQRGLGSTGFQTLNWLTVLYEELAPSHRAMPRLVVVSDRSSGDVCLILPLVVKMKRGLRVARFADLGVAEYGAPILGPAAPTKRRSIRRMWRSVRAALKDVDLIRLERMPAEIGGRANPLVTRRGVTPARHTGYAITVTGTVDEYLRTLGKKYRKEVERCTRLWAQEGNPKFARAETGEAIARGYSLLEEHQAQRQVALGGKYVLGEQPYSAFYERIVMDGFEPEFSYLFTLEAKTDVIATLFGVVHDGTFTLLRIANGGPAFKHMSPGRLIIVEAMKYFVARGVTRFDLGIGDQNFKRRLGAKEVPLYDLFIARDLKAYPKAAFHRFKGRLRQNMRLRATARDLKAKVKR